MLEYRVIRFFLRAYDTPNILILMFPLHVSFKMAALHGGAREH